MKEFKDSGRSVRRTPFKHKTCPSPYSGREGDASGDKTSLAKQRSQDGGPVQKGNTQKVETGTGCKGGI